MNGSFVYDRFNLKILISFLLVILLAGCAAAPSYYSDIQSRGNFKIPPTFVIIDQMPEGSTKGYVEFYGNSFYNRGFFHVAPIFVYRVENGEEILKAKLSGWSRSRFAMSPGNYHFVIKAGTASEQVYLKIEEGMITLLGIDVKIIKSDMLAYKTVTYFNWKVHSSERLMPLTSSPESIDTFLPALEDSDWGIRAFAAEALGNLKDRRATEPLISVVLNRQEDLTVRVIAMEALGRINDPRAIEPLITILRNEHDPKENTALKQYAAGSLGKFNDYTCIEPLIDATKDSDVFIRESAMEALAEIGGPGVDQLILWLKDKNYPHRESVAKALGKAKDPGAIVPLTAATKDKDKYVRKRARDSLKMIRKRSEKK